MSVLPDDPKARKEFPMATGLLDYFPDALAYVSHVSFLGGQQHNPGKPLHWDRSKSGDESDALMRHFLDRGTRDEDGLRHSAKVAWRALALLQTELEKSEPAKPGPKAESKLLLAAAVSNRITLANSPLTSPLAATERAPAAP